MPFEFQRLRIPELVLVQPKRFPDQRGWFMETYKHSAFVEAGITTEFVQDNMSFSTHGVLRGLHYQIAPAEQAKLVTVLQGEIFDVAVDLRPDSATRLGWIGASLSAERGDALFIPAGFAHGFVVLSKDALVLYKCSAEFAPDCERGIRWDDPAIDIQWPLSNPIVSDRDRQLPSLEEVSL